MGPGIKRLILLWCGISVPSLVLWGAIIRLNRHGAPAFARTWRWLAHLLTVPLVLSPLTHPAWHQLLDGGGLLAFLAFVLLVAVWSLMIALPIALLLSWVHWLGGRMVGESGGGTPLLYAVTLPVALIGHALRWLLKGLPAALLTFVVVWLARFGWQYVTLQNGDPDRFYGRLVAMDHLWHGLYGDVGMHTFLTAQWNTHFTPTHQLARQFLAAPDGFSAYQERPSRYGDVLWLLGWDATMLALICAIAVLVLVVVFKAIRQMDRPNNPEQA